MEHGIDTAKVTKPLQLLAAWLIGLVVTNGSFLTAAATIKNPEWAPGVLVIASIVNVPVFLFCLFLLQTRFRPEMQEDQYYAQYLETRFSSTTGQSELIDLRIEKPTELPTYLQPSLPPTVINSLAPESDTKIWINDLIPTYQRLFEELKNAGRKPTNIFGRTAARPETPSPLIISITGRVDLQALSDIVRISLPHGLQTVRKGTDYHNEERIYIGSFSYRASPIEGPLPNNIVMSKIVEGKLTYEELEEILQAEET